MRMALLSTYTAPLVGADVNIITFRCQCSWRRLAPHAERRRSRLLKAQAHHYPRREFGRQRSVSLERKAADGRVEARVSILGRENTHAHVRDV